MAEIKPYDMIGMTGDKVAAVQRHLASLGMYDGAIDGNMTWHLVVSIDAYQKRMGLSVDNPDPALRIKQTGIWDATTEQATNSFVHYTSGGRTYWSAQGGGVVNYNPAASGNLPIGSSPIGGANPTPAPPTGTPVQTPQTGNDGVNLVSAKAILSGYLTGLGFTNMGGFIDKLLVEGIFDGRAAYAIMMNPNNDDPVYREAHETFKARFPVIFENTPWSNLTPDKYLQLEESYREALSSSLLPPGMFDSADDFTNFIRSGISPNELRARIDQGYDRVKQSAPEVREMFGQYFGVYGDGALAALFLDPTPGRMKELLEKVEEAAVGAAGMSYGIAVARDLAQRLVDVGYAEGTARKGFSQLAQLSGLFQETLGENQDFTIEQEGIATMFDVGSPEMRKAVEARRSGRVNMLQGGGQAAITDAGVLGFGSNA